MSEDPQTDSASLLDEYFEAWREHDVEKLKVLFSANAEYEIIGKRTITGIEEIEKYWQRNKSRQNDLQVLPHFSPCGDESALDRIFCAKFFDSEEGQFQTVYGHLKIEIDNKKIIKLSECYDLHRENMLKIQFRQKAEQYWRIISRFLKGWGIKLWELLLSKGTTVVSVLMAIVLGYSAFSFGRLPDIALCLIATDFSACGDITEDTRDALIGTTTQRLSMITAIFVLIIPLLFYWKNYYFKPVRTKTLQDATQDLEEMKQRFKEAKSVTIFSGDFDFIRNDEEFVRIFRKLDESGSLTLISNKSVAEVQEGFGTEREALELFDSLNSKKKIQYDQQEPIKCSIVQYWNHTEILYRYDHGGNEEELNRLRLCILRGRGDVLPAVDLIKSLSAKYST